MAKMCPYYKIKYRGRTMTYCQHPDWVNGKMKASTAAIKKFCPTNTTTGCQIIPKRESKVRRVKAWAFVFMGKIGLVQIDAYSDRNISHKGLRPCTILIDEKKQKKKK